MFLRKGLPSHCVPEGWEVSRSLAGVPMACLGCGQQGLPRAHCEGEQPGAVEPAGLAQEMGLSFPWGKENK